MIPRPRHPWPLPRLRQCGRSTRGSSGGPCARRAPAPVPWRPSSCPAGVWSCSTTCPANSRSPSTPGASHCSVLVSPRRQIDSNKFMHLPVGLLDELKKVEQVKLSMNPWHCDCFILYLTRCVGGRGASRWGSLREHRFREWLGLKHSASFSVSSLAAVSVLVLARSCFWSKTEGNTRVAPHRHTPSLSQSVSSYCCVCASRRQRARPEEEEERETEKD